MNSMNFVLKKLSGEENVNIDFDQLLVIGFAGRNIEKTMEHIRELEEQLGVPAPKQIPTIFECSLELLTQGKDIKFVGNKTSGEVEYIIVKSGEKIYIGLGSDHTDRELESVSIPKAKQVSPKPIAGELWDYEEVKDHWDQIRLVSYQTINGEEVKYQDGTLSDILPVEKILSVLTERIGNIDNSIIYSGTVPVLDGFKYGDNFRSLMIDEALNRSIEFNYNVNVISEEER
jgi:hypothetical protein